MPTTAIAPTRRVPLSDERARLLDLMRGIGYGRILGLHVRSGQPVFDPQPRVVREIKLSAEPGPHMAPVRDEALIKVQERRLFEEFVVLGNGVVQEVEVKDGLPFRMAVEGGLA